MPDWLFGECYDAVGDLAETIALLLPPAGGVDRPAAALLGGGAAAAPARVGRRRAARFASLAAWRRDGRARSASSGTS